MTYVAGHKVPITDRIGNTTTYSYNSVGQLTSTITPLGTATYVYDAAGQMSGTTDGNGRHASFTYNAADQKTGVQWFTGQGQLLNTTTYTFDSNANLTSESDFNSKYTYSYDADGHVIRIDNQGTPGAPHLVLTYAYDNFGNKTSVHDNFGTTISYAYNGNNLVASASMVVSGTQGPQATMAYDAINDVTGITRRVTGSGAKITSAFTYDNGNRLTTITHNSSAAGALATYLYSYDAASQLTQYTGPEGTLTYTYDATGQLTAVGDARSENYSYDLNGNRTMPGYSTGTDNTLTADGTNTYAYDSNGNMTSQTRQSDGQVTNYTWDYGNRLSNVVVKTSAGVTVTNDVFTYDVDNRRIGKSINGTQYWFGFDQHNSYIDFNAAGSVIERYLTGLGEDQLYARYDGTSAAFYLDDNLGSVRQLVNVGGTVLDQLTYDSFGNTLTESNAVNGDRFKYASREWDAELGVYFNRARYYRPADGNWTSADPSGFDGGDVNLFCYVHNEPVLATDPTGCLTLTVGGVRATCLAEAGFGSMTMRFTPEKGLPSGSDVQFVQMLSPHSFDCLGGDRSFWLRGWWQVGQQGRQGADHFDQWNSEVCDAAFQPGNGLWNAFYWNTQTNGATTRAVDFPRFYSEGGPERGVGSQVLWLRMYLIYRGPRSKDQIRKNQWRLYKPVYCASWYYRETYDGKGGRVASSSGIVNQGIYIGPNPAGMYSRYLQVGFTGDNGAWNQRRLKCDNPLPDGVLPF